MVLCAIVVQGSRLEGKFKLAQPFRLRLPNEFRRRNATVSSAEDFYDYADEHLGWAETAKTECERAVFLQMAAAWLEVAQRWETSARRRAAEAE